jgi:hypothetical protein
MKKKWAVLAFASTVVGSVGGIMSCGKFSSDSTEIARRENAAKDSTKPENFDAKKIVDGINISELPPNTKIPNISPIQCKKQKNNQKLVTSFTQDLFGRPPTAKELSQANLGEFNYDYFVSKSLKESEADNGITRFVNNLFRVDGIPLPQGNNNASEVQLVTELKMEPATLVLRNKDKKWSWFWNTKEIFCTQNTANLYGTSRIGAQGFVSCTLPPERSGFLSLVSVLRATSTTQNPQAFYLSNNNYHRVKAMLYFVKGIQLEAATNGPKGTGDIVPMAECVPTTDMRADAAGKIFGTASVPLSGSTCAGCHSPYNGPLSIPFRRFGEKGETLDFNSLDKLPGDKTQGVDRDFLKTILAEQNSCWSPDGNEPIPFEGLVGLGNILENSPTFGQALGIQIPQLLANIPPDENTTTSIANRYYKGGQTLLSAFEGFFTSDSYKCEVK